MSAQKSLSSLTSETNKLDNEIKETNGKILILPIASVGEP